MPTNGGVHQDLPSALLKELHLGLSKVKDLIIFFRLALRTWLRLLTIILSLTLIFLSRDRLMAPLMLLISLHELLLRYLAVFHCLTAV